MIFGLFTNRGGHFFSSQSLINCEECFDPQLQIIHLTGEELQGGAEDQGGDQGQHGGQEQCGADEGPTDDEGEVCSDKHEIKRDFLIVYKEGCTFFS